MRKRRALDALADISAGRIDIIVGHADISGCIDVIVGQADVIDYLAFRDTDADALSGPAACFACAVTDGTACAVSSCVVLPAHEQREVLPTRPVLPYS